MKKTIIILLMGVVLCLSTSCNFFNTNLEKNSKSDNAVTPKTIGEIAYNDNFDYKVHIKENDEYIPYFVVTNNYNNNTLLMRENSLEDEMPFNKEYKINYYPESDLDYFLNNSFINNFSDTMKNIIIDTEIEVTSYYTLDIDISRRETELINRKIFLLSATECGIETTMATKEGEKIENIDKFISSERQWLRSAYLWNYDSFWVISNNEHGSDRAENDMYVYPVFTIPSDTEVEYSNEIIEGECIFILKAEKLS